MGKFINPPPAVVPFYFQDRVVETQLIRDFLTREDLSIMTIVGRPGIGKTALVCRLFKFLERGELPDGHGPFAVGGILYLSNLGTKKVSFSNVFWGLSKLLPEKEIVYLKTVLQDAELQSQIKIEMLLKLIKTNYPNEKILILLDNFESSLNNQTQFFLDPELGAFLETLFSDTQHPIKVIITSRVPLPGSLFSSISRQMRIDLDEGLPSPFAENLLREMDVDGRVGLRTASDELLVSARKLTGGYPRALEALFALLSSDRDLELKEVLENNKNILPENITKVLIGEAYQTLDSLDQSILQALAIYGRPTSSAGIDFMLSPFIKDIESRSRLKKLVNLKLVRKENSLYYLHPIDRSYILSQIEEGSPADRASVPLPYSRIALLHLGASYYRSIRVKRHQIKDVDDLTPQLAEYDLHFAGGNYSQAADVIGELDQQFLLRWGFFHYVAITREGLIGRLSENELKQRNYGMLGYAYWGMGEFEKGFQCFMQALNIARAMSDKHEECEWIGAIAIYYTNKGDIQAAQEYTNMAIQLAREINDRKLEATKLYHLGHIYFDLGKSALSIEYYQKALSLNEEIEDFSQKAAILSKLGSRYANIGEFSKAQEFFDEALVISNEKGLKVLQSISLIMLANMNIVLGNMEKAIEFAEQGVTIADEIRHSRFQNFGRSILGAAYLGKNRVSDARKTLEEAIQYHALHDYHNSLLALGIALMRDLEIVSAQKVFLDTIEETNAYLKYNRQNYKLLDSQALAYCGLSILNKNESYREDAKRLFEEARKINDDTGIVRAVEHLLNEILKFDPSGSFFEIKRLLH